MSLSLYCLLVLILVCLLSPIFVLPERGFILQHFIFSAERTKYEPGYLFLRLLEDAGVESTKDGSTGYNCNISI